MENNRVNYKKSTFSEVKGELENLIRNYYPEVLSDFTDSSVGSMLIDLNAGVSNNLSINLDRAFNETQLEFAQQDESILGIAKTLGFSIPNRRPSVTVVDYTVRVPVKGDKPDESYYPVLQAGSQVIGGSQTFENERVIDWSSPVGSLGEANRRLVPVTNANGIIVNYEVTKREVVLNGSTNIFRRVITNEDIRSFFKVRLPDPDVISVSDVILVPGTSFNGDPTEEDFNNPDFKFYQVDYLAQQRVFVDSDTQNNNNTLKVGRWIDVTRKYIKEFTKNGFCELTFGSGDGETDALRDGLLKAGVSNQEFLRNYLENTALGERLRPDHTLFIRYKSGGGSSSNLGSNSITQLGAVDLSVNGSRQEFNNEVVRSLKVTNPIPAIGGNDGLSVEQVRNLTKYNFSSQRRDVQLNDYLFRILSIDGRYGSPFRATVFKENNKVVIPILGLGSDGKLNNTSNSLLKENITEYLTESRTVNDYVEVRDGRIFNLAVRVELLVNNQNDSQIANSVIRRINQFFSVNEKQMNENIYITPLYEILNNVSNVINVISLRFFNKVGGQYSKNSVEQELLSQQTGEISLINSTIFSANDSMFEIKFPQRDIEVVLRKNTN